MSSEIKAGLLGNKYLEAKFYRPYFEIIDNKIKLISVISILSSKISTITIEYLSQPILVDLQEDEMKAMLTRARYWNSKEGEEIIKVALKLILERGSP
jgi:hypothetical protein